MSRMMTFSASCTGLSGVASAFAASVFIGPIGAVASAIGSSIAWIMASVYGWQVSPRHALVAFDSYPNLMVMHMIRSSRLMGLERVRLDTPEKIQEFWGRIMRQVQY
ncbi:hypothetical protein DOTSEDRAFT_29451 [Dothistroma septosporum NZE10]|uniref:Uncharacterized protein n=1 Tax=Dothistroma septosporum (strain NZE10 / CBS 128990) TaxID=675120 RepID=N1PC85_DOTSN|nr:hypothetical protein DOTSEDRAFT_29451 [Dothistroma septosporum NZE10]